MDEHAKTKRQCRKCGLANLHDAKFCANCGTAFSDSPRSVTRETEALERDRKLLLFEDVTRGTNGRLRSVYTQLQESGFSGFAPSIEWPRDGSGTLVQQFPEGAAALGDVLNERPEFACGWKLRLIEQMARAIDDLATSGARLNSINLDSIVIDRETGGFAGFCLPLSLTSAHERIMPVEGIDCRFAPPELQGYVDAPPGLETDVFLLGIVALRLLTNSAPRDLLSCDFEPLGDAGDLGPSVRQILSEALAIKPSERPSTAVEFVTGLRTALVDDAACDSFDFTYSVDSDIGLGGRGNNEDACCAWTRIARGSTGHVGLAAFAVADGMGGTAMGERASSLAIERLLAEMNDNLPTFGRSFEDMNTLPSACSEWVRGVNEAVRDLGHRFDEPDNVGTTLTGLIFVGRHCVLVHVGDSRVYRLRAGTITQLSRDQTLAEQMRSSGELCKEEPNAESYDNILVSHLGTERCDPQAEVLDVRPGDVFMLCSDGLVEGLSSPDIAETLADVVPQSAARALVERARRDLLDRQRDRNEVPCSDNITAVVVRVSGITPRRIDAAVTAATPTTSREPLSDSDAYWAIAEEDSRTDCLDNDITRYHRG